MKHERFKFALWDDLIHLYSKAMVRKLYNHRMLANQAEAGSAFFRFLDVYAMSMDVMPPCNVPVPKRGADRLWADFVAIAGDTERAIAANTDSGTSAIERCRKSERFR